MAVAIQSSSTKLESSLSTITIDKPSGVVSGDLLIAQVSVRRSNTTWSVPSGWTELHDQTMPDDTNGSLAQVTAWKIAGGSEPSNYTFTPSGADPMAGIILRITGHDPTTPIGASSGLADNSPDTTADGTAITPQANSLLLMAISACRSGVSAAPTLDTYAIVTSDPGGWAEVVAEQALGTNPGCSQVIAYATRVQSTSTGTPTATASGTVKSIVHFIAITPDPAVSVTVTIGAPLAATFSLPAVTISAIQNITVSSSILSATFSSLAPAISGGANVAPSVLSATFSIPLVDVYTPDALVSPNALTATFDAPDPTVVGEANVSQGTPLSATFSIPTPAVAIGASISAGVLTATFTLQAPVVTAEQSVTASAGVLSATFSLPASAVEIGQLVEPSPLTATFTIPAFTVTAQRFVTVDASVLVATFSLVRPRKMGGAWSPQPREVGDWTAQPRTMG